MLPEYCAGLVVHIISMLGSGSGGSVPVPLPGSSSGIVVPKAIIYGFIGLPKTALDTN